MLRWLIAVPLAIIVMLLLFIFMASIIDYRHIETPKSSPAVGFNMLMVEDDQALERRERSLPKPPELPKMPPEIQRSQPRTVTEPISSAPTPMDLQFDTAVQGVAIAAPKLGEFSLEMPAQSHQQAMPLFRVEPNYPARALTRKIEGFVVMSFTIDVSGRVTDIRVLEAEPARVFDREAVRALRQWKYQPKIEAGKEVSQPNQTLKMEFKLVQ